MTEGILDPFERAIAEFEELTIYAEPAALEDTQTAEGTRSEPADTKCAHYGVDSGGTDYYGTSNPPQESDWNYAYCPKCGVEL